MKQNKELIYQIALTQIPGIGDVLTRNLVSYCGGVENVFNQKKHKLLKIPGIGEKLADSIITSVNLKKAEDEIRFIEKHHIQPMFYLDDLYPSRLKNFNDAPTLLYSIGNANLNQQKIVAIVGTRKATEYGKSFINKLIEDLKSCGCLILSGLAFGIDIHAHREAIKNDLPTVAVLAHGFDRIYPATHKQTAKKMLENGGLLTEFPSNTNPDRENFPKRNRIVAGLCDVLIVVETAEKGGALITAEIANSYNKDVMALPGRISDEYSSGCNKLIKLNKAAIITCVDDLYYLMGWNLENRSKKAKQQVLPIDLTNDELNIIQFIQLKSKVGIDELAFALQVDSGNLSLTLLDLEFKGLIRSLPGKYFELN